MKESTRNSSCAASPFGLALELTASLLPLWKAIAELVQQFLAVRPSPESTHQFENTLHDLLRKIGLLIMAWVFNHIEPETKEESPARIMFEREEYRRKPKSPNHEVGTLFGEFRLDRLLYEPLESGLRSIFPLEIELGVVARNATPAFAERVAELATDSTQGELLSILKRQHGVHWSADTLRKVTAGVSEGMSPHLHTAQVSQVLEWLRKAQQGKGKHPVTMAVGRDGIFLPIRGGGYKEGAVGTVSVHDRSGKRLGTVYLGQMPEAYQLTLSNRLTHLIRDVLAACLGPLPRLAFVSDAGNHPTEYYQSVLQRMLDPRKTGRYLQWTWIVDFYHASEYVGKLAQSLFGDTAAGHAWARKMCKWLKHKPNAVYRVLHSTAKFRSERVLSAKAEEEYQKAYAYLNNHKAYMDYSHYRQQGLPIGSGVTEAACKTVFTQRFKQAGMSWNVSDGQTILDLRVIRLSKLWSNVHHAYLVSRPKLTYATEHGYCDTYDKIAA